MTEQRTEEQKVARSPITVVLGGESHEIEPLVIRESRKWRAKVVEALSVIPGYAKATTDDTELFKTALNAMLVQMPDTVLDLFFDYAVDLDRDQIESIANDSEIAKAFEQVVGLAFPLAQSLVGTMVKLSP